MFTGVVKLAQIDDYIAPSQNCIQPKIMKNDDKLEKATVTLNDCLACSGCITSAQSILIEQMSIKKFMQFAQDKESEVFIVISPQALLSLTKYYNTSVSLFMIAFSRFLKKNYPSVRQIYDLTVGVQISHDLIFKEYLERKQQKNFPVICSECPGWVCYAQKTKNLGKVVTDHMSHVKSPQQIMGRLIRQKYGDKCKIVSIMPCYDKKLEAIRFDIEKGIKEVDLTLASIQVVDLIKQNFKKIEQEASSAEQFKTQYLEKVQGEAKEQGYHFANILDENKIPIQFLEDQTSNGYIDTILKKLEITNYECQEIRNSDFIEYSCEVEGQKIKMAKCYGFRNIQKAVQAIKKGKSPYHYIQMMACPGGCFSGGGQVRYENIKNKEVVSEIKEIKNKHPVYNTTQNLPENISSVLQKAAVTAEYHPIEQTLTEAVMNW